MTTDTKTQLANRIISKEGVWAGVAIFLVAFIGWMLSVEVKAIREDQRQHMSETGFYLFHICVNTSPDEKRATECKGLQR